ncbi:MAG: hypothetical protein ACWA47_05250 [Brevirhabdus sp.]
MRFFWIGFFCVLAGAAAAQSAISTSDQYWLLHEDRRMRGADCPDGAGCAWMRRYDLRLFDRSLNAAMAEIMSRLRSEGPAAPNPPKFCENRAFEATLNFDPDALEEAEKLEVLRDLPGVYFDLSGLKAPEGFVGDFGLNLQVAFEGRFKRAGIRVLSKQEAEGAPGKPMMNVYFSHTNPKTGCWYSVFASLSQTAVLTRNPLVKFRAGTWSASSGVKTVGDTGTEYDAILWVADKFVRDYLAANGKDTASK